MVNAWKIDKGLVSQFVGDCLSVLFSGWSGGVVNVGQEQAGERAMRNPIRWFQKGDKAILFV